MSDAPQSPDWFKASDGKWYPPPPGAQAPQQAAPAPPAQDKKKGGCLKIGGLVVLGIIVLMVIVAAVASDDDDDGDAADGNGEVATGNGDSSDTRNLDLYPDRADRQENDHEAEQGQAVRLAGYTASVDSAALEEHEFAGQNVVITVTIENRDDGAQPYNLFDWRIQTDGGQVLDPTINLRDDDLGSGDLVSGGSTTGTVAFDVGPGAYYVIYKPDAFSSHRGVWRIEVG
jgi:hypothetical protein